MLGIQGRGLRRSLGATALVALAATAVVMPSHAQSAPRTPPAPDPRAVRTTPAADLGMADIAGVTFDPSTGELVVTDGRPTGTVTIDRRGDVVGRRAMPAGTTPATLTFGGDGRSVAPAAGVRTAEIDASDGSWVGLRNDGRQIVITQDAPTEARSARRVFDLSAIAVPAVAAAPNPVDGLVWVLADALYGIDRTGAVSLVLPLPPGIDDPLDMVFAPTADQTDPASAQSLFVVDGTAGTSRTTAELVEVTLEPQAVALAAVASTATLVRTTDLSRLTPPAPDSSGVVYIPSQDRLMVSDSEVEEMAIYQGTNLFQLTRGGSLVDTGTTVGWSDEPTGLGYRASSNTLLVSDDDRDRVYSDAPGNDGRWGTADDSITSIATSFTGNNDCEDVTHLASADHLFTIDGVNKEVYRYTMSGTFVGQFDVGAYGAGDPEGIVYDDATDSLFVLDDASRTIYQVDLVGNLLQTIDITGINAIKAAGIAAAPASNGSGIRNLYIVDRGIDNDNNPTENDGKLYEISIPGSGVVNQPPTLNAGTDQQITLPGTATLSGAVGDDGLPTGSTVTSTWTTVSGPAPVTFADPSSPTTVATFDAGGVYTLRLTANDTLATSFDDVQITVIDPNAPSTFSVSIAASADDVEENNATGNVNRSSADLELVQDGTSLNQTVGLRFMGVNIPTNATITSATIQFTVDEVKTAATSLTIRGERSLNPPTYTGSAFNVTSRPDTATTTAWSPAPWPTVGAAGADQRTPDLASIVQEIIGQPGWSTGNAVAFTISGSGVRTAQAFDFGSGAPRLSIDYTIGDPPPPVNVAPSVNAGANTSVTLPNTLTLAGTVTDDGLPNNTLTIGWSQTAGPAGGTATVTTPNSPTSTVSFDLAGTYTLRLTANDGLLTTTDDIDITVSPAPGGSVTVTRSIAAFSDDAEENDGTLAVDLKSSDLEIVTDGRKVQTIGLRFTGVTVPAEATIVRAYVQFSTNRARSNATSLTVFGVLQPNPATFTTTAGNVSGRPDTTGVLWAPVPWTVAGETGVNQRTPDLSSVVSTLIAQPGWAAGNAMAFTISGTGLRQANSFGFGQAAQLVIEYSTP